MRTGVVHLSHPQSSLLCSGTVVAPNLVVATKHCVMRPSGSGYEALGAAGFRVGFGPDTEHLELRDGSELRWIGSPTDLDVDGAVAAGLDVATITLSEPVPAGTHVHPIDLDYRPAAGDQVEIIGYGLSSLGSWDSGVKRSTLDAVTALGSTTGIVETTGKGACNGDSGGPFLFGSTLALVGVVSEIAGSLDGGVCDLGVTDAASVVNPTVRQFLSDELTRLPPCEARAEICQNDQDDDCDGQVDEGCGGQGQGVGGGSVGGGDDGVSGSSLAAGAAGAPGGETRRDEGGISGGHVSQTADNDHGGCSCIQAHSDGPGRSRTPAALGALLLLAGSLRRRTERQRAPGSRLNVPGLSPQSARHPPVSPYRWFGLLGVSLLALVPCACKKGTSDADEAPPAVTGQRECDLFLARYEQCVENRLPEEQQRAHRKAFDVHKAAWKRASATPGGKAALVATCRQVTEHVRLATESYGCKF